MKARNSSPESGAVEMSGNLQGSVDFHLIYLYSWNTEVSHSPACLARLHCTLPVLLQSTYIWLTVTGTDFIYEVTGILARMHVCKRLE